MKTYTIPYDDVADVRDGISNLRGYFRYLRSIPATIELRPRPVLDMDNKLWTATVYALPEGTAGHGPAHFDGAPGPVPFGMILTSKVDRDNELQVLISLGGGAQSVYYAKPHQFYELKFASPPPSVLTAKRRMNWSNAGAVKRVHTSNRKLAL